MFGNVMVALIVAFGWGGMWFVLGLSVGQHSAYRQGRIDGRRAQQVETELAMGMASEPINKPPQLMTHRDPCPHTDDAEHDWSAPRDPEYLQIGRIIPEGNHAYQCLKCGVWKLE
jgi:hypothetical protein